MPRSIRRIRVAQNSSHILGLVLTLLGLTPIIVVLLNAWTSGVSFLDLSALYEFLWTNRFNIGFGIGFELVYVIIVGIVTMLLGVLLLARKTEQIDARTILETFWSNTMRARLANTS